MKFCSDCGNSVPDNLATCSNCGKDQRVAQPVNTNNLTKQHPVQSDDTFLKVLCILTIVGATMSLMSLAFTFGMPTKMDHTVSYIVQIVSVLITIGKLTGAILMLQKRLTGLYMYTAAASVSIALTVAMAFGFNAVEVQDNLISEAIVTLVFVISIIIAAAFLIMYWLKMNRKLLS